MDTFIYENLVKMNISNYRYNMNEKTLVFTIISGIDFICTRYTAFSTTGYNKLTLFHIGKVNIGFITPKFV